jgi:hypothetical protein
VFTPELVARTVAAMNTPEANAKKGLAKLGKPRPAHVRKLLDKTGRKASPETRAKMSAAHKARGTWPPSDATDLKYATPPPCTMA